MPRFNVQNPIIFWIENDPLPLNFSENSSVLEAPPVPEPSFQDRVHDSLNRLSASCFLAGLLEDSSFLQSEFLRVNIDCAMCINVKDSCGMERCAGLLLLLHSHGLRLCELIAILEF